LNFRPLRPPHRPPTPWWLLVWADQRAVRAVLTLWVVAMLIGSLAMVLAMVLAF
jgi:hypothetical protein